MANAPAADISVVDVPAHSRFEVRVAGETAGFTEYRRSPGLIAFVHTLIDPRRGPRPGLAARPLGAHGRALRRRLGASILPVRPVLHRRPSGVPRPGAGGQAIEIRPALPWLSRRPPASSTEATVLM